MKKIIILASGTKDGGGSGCKHILEAIDKKLLNAKVIGIVSQHHNGGVYRIAKARRIPFLHMAGPYDEAAYQLLIPVLGEPDLIVLSGWIKKVVGLQHIPTVNVHPAPLPEFGGQGMYGLAPHTAVIQAGRTHTAISIHWVNDVYDGGDIIFSKAVPIQVSDTAELLQERVKQYEWFYYPRVIHLLLRQELHLLPQLEDYRIPA